MELICRPWLGRSFGSLPATPTHLLASPLERSGRETPLSVDSLPLEWDHTGDVGGSSSHEDEEDEEDEEEERAYFSALSGKFTDANAPLLKGGRGCVCVCVMVIKLFGYSDPGFCSGTKNSESPRPVERADKPSALQLLNQDKI